MEGVGRQIDLKLLTKSLTKNPEFSLWITPVDNLLIKTSYLLEIIKNTLQKKPVDNSINPRLFSLKIHPFSETVSKRFRNGFETVSKRFNSLKINIENI